MLTASHKLLGRRGTFPCATVSVSSSQQNSVAHTTLTCTPVHIPHVSHTEPPVAHCVLPLSHSSVSLSHGTLGGGLLLEFSFQFDRENQSSFSCAAGYHVFVACCFQWDCARGGEGFFYRKSRDALAINRNGEFPDLPLDFPPCQFKQEEGTSRNLSETNGNKSLRMC